MGRGTQNLFTLWTPFGENPIEMGTLAVIEGSHKLDNFKDFQVCNTISHGSLVVFRSIRPKYDTVLFWKLSK